MDEDGYPEEHELKRIAEWPHDDWAALLEYVRERWTYQDRWTVADGKLFVSTGGWSGNEDLIRALQRAESDLVIGQVMPKILDRKIAALPLHDAIFAAPDDLPKVAEVFEDVFRERNFYLSLKVEHP